MGTLYLARDPMLDRLVAIKVMRLDVQAGDIRARFEREARSISRLRHPNIVTIFEYGEHGGEPYIVMEYIRGESLADVIRRRAPLPVARKLQLVEQLCAGLAYAHRAKIVHRDIKPANLMIDAESGALKILDFGIARSLESNATRFTHVIGTPAYMSPEQASGQQVDQRSDVFAVGCVSYELLAYRRAFDDASPAQVMKQIVKRDPVPLTAFVPNLDPALVALIDKALRKHPADRYQDLDAMRGDIARVQRYEDATVITDPVVDAPQTLVLNTEPRVDVMSPRPSYAGFVAAGGIVLLAVVAAGVIAVWPVAEPSSAQPIASPALSAPREPGAISTQPAEAPIVPAPTSAESIVPRADPSRGDARHAAAKSAFDQRRFADAARLYQEILAAHPDSPSAAAGLKSARGALDHQRRTVDDFIRKGNSLRADGMLEGAIRSYEAALVVDPASSQAAQALNNAKLAKQRLDSEKARPK